MIKRCTPLELWLDWLQDEIDLCDSERAREKVVELFSRAVGDYLSPEVWRLYCSFLSQCTEDAPADTAFTPDRVRAVHTEVRDKRTRVHSFLHVILFVLIFVVLSACVRRINSFA
jgi:hypothetical protein